MIDTGNCGCANPVCMKHGCQRQQQRQGTHNSFNPLGYSAPLHPMYYPDQTRPVMPVDEHAVRRIVREELERLNASRPGQPSPREGALAPSHPNSSDPTLISQLIETGRAEVER